MLFLDLTIWIAVGQAKDLKALRPPMSPKVYKNGKRHGKSIQYQKGKPAYKSYYVFGKRIMRI